jgi:hypothetical protein
MIIDLIIAFILLVALRLIFWYGLNNHPPVCYYCGEPLERGKEHIGLAGEKCCVVCYQRECGR